MVVGAEKRQQRDNDEALLLVIWQTSSITETGFWLQLFSTTSILPAKLRGV